MFAIHMVSKHKNLSHKQSLLFYGTLISVISVNNGPCCSVTCFNVMIPSTVGEALYIELQGYFLSSFTYRCWIENFDVIQSLRWFSFRLRWILEEAWSDYRAKVTKHFLSLWLQSNDNDALASKKKNCCVNSYDVLVTSSRMNQMIHIWLHQNRWHCDTEFDGGACDSATKPSVQCDHDKN